MFCYFNFMQFMINLRIVFQVNFVLHLPPGFLLCVWVGANHTGKT